MAAEASTNGDSQTPAQKLEARLAQEESHRPTVEDVPDEDDLAHPAPSVAPSEKGKQKAQDVETPKKSPANPPINIASEEMFPGLGAPKAHTPAAVSSAWGRKPASVSANGVNGAAASNGTSRASTPASGIATPTTPSVRGPGPQTMTLPGRYVESISLAPSQMIPRQLQKKPMADVIRDINRRSKAKVEMKPGNMGNIVFQGTGPVDAVRSALREVAKELGSKQTTKVTIPASIRAHVIGRQGATIQGISKRTGARIQVPKQEETGSFEEDDSATIDVVIEGDTVAAALAKQEIERIVDERTSTVNLRLKDIPAEYYPFLAGPHNSRIDSYEGGRDVRVQIPHYTTWAEQAPPQPTPAGQPVPFAPQAAYPISISGDRAAANEARAEIERQVEELRRQLSINQMPIERGRHQFIIGERGGSLHDFLAETGCAVILPPSHDDTEMLTIVGPADKLESGINKVMDLATSMQSTNVDIARQHANSQAHARDLTRYLRQRQAIAELERMHDASIVLPTSQDGPTAWEIYSRDAKNGMKARMDIMNLISSHPPSRFSNVNVDPFYHQHLRQRAAQNLRKDQGVHLLFPEGAESPHLVLVYEGPSSPSEYQFPRGQPSAQDVQAFQRALQEAQKQLLSLINSEEQIVGRDVEAPQNSYRFHDKIRRYVDREQQGLPQDQIPLQVLFGDARPQASRANRDNVYIRGPNKNVDELAQKILEFIEQEKKDELERGYTITFDYPQKFANILIGKRGENIKKLRDEFDVDIQVQDGKVEIKGPQAKAHAAKAHIIALGKKLEDEATYVLKIKPQYHRDLIGGKGNQVNRLQDRYNVRINFPRSAAAAADDADAGTEASHHNRRQAADEVIIRGPKRGADAARDELLELYQYTIDNSHTATVSVAQSQIPSLIGAGGREMDALRASTGAQIDVPNAREVADASGRADIKIKGTKKQVEDAKKLLEQKAKTFDETVVRTIEVDKKHHKALIGAGGANIRDIVINAGGPDDRRELARMVRFPRAESEENTIRVEGNAAVVDKIVAAIEGLVSTRDSQVTEFIEVAPEKHRMLIGRGGETRRNLESQFKVTVDVPKQTATGAARSQVKIVGQPQDVEKAKEHIASMIKEQEGETVQVPRRLHHAVSDNGQFFRRLRNDLRVTVDHAGQQPPPKPTTAGASNIRANAGSNAPLITDDPSSTKDAHAWDIVDNLPASDDSEDGNIPWILRSSNPENVAKAKALLEKAMEEKSKPSCTGYLILPDPKLYRYVVGPGGSQINSIRKKTGTRVQVPRGGDGNEAIEIVGSREGVEQARDIILELVKDKN
ncbi:RNA binding effector protein [Lasiodiplodia theobromae]|uniref:RNA binding effector protein n=1 Tax=Lasiodiplodia theobromae TaxID=45133 RepID=UPI0015C304DE|nr:RNA binding effector protein [Lasiodiplodia theobromae]KAF4541960.1 RNA binding effector protein [Lasiodiplodia theobromae]